MMTAKMSLKIKNWRKFYKWIFYAALVGLFAKFIIKVAVFEHKYYEEKEGSERAIIVTRDEPEEELIEVEPTEEEVIEYVVAPDRPRYLTIEKLGIYNSRILPMGVNSKGELMTPNNIFDVGWYDASGKPGQGGTMIIDGHNGGPHVYGVFKKLPSLVEGDLITIERGDGVIYEYAIVENNEIPLYEANAYMSVAAKSPEPGKESVTLITCAGEWSDVQDTYLSRQFVRAVIKN